MAGILARFRGGMADPKAQRRARQAGVEDLANIPSQDRALLIPPVLAPVLAALVLACPRRIRLRHVRAMTTAGMCGRLRDLIYRRVAAS
jgi:hypothetical protein